jgi:hypothetical protein
MKPADIIKHRLANQQISANSFKTPAELIHWFGAMQAQDFPMAKWAIGSRIKSLTEKDIDDAVSKGKIIRTHALRPTWHFVSAKDIYWILELTAPQIKAQSRSRDKELGLTEKIYTRSNTIIEKALSDVKNLTRQELVTALNKARIQTDEYRSGHLLLRAELDALICSGSANGNQTTYALLSKKVKRKTTLPREEALAILAKRYFHSHGPATALDYGWWSGLPVKDVKNSIELIKSDLASEELDGQTYWFIPSSIPTANKQASVHLLPAFDEYLISYKNRGAAMELEHHKKAFTINGIFKPIVVINGKVVGIWKRTVTKDSVTIVVDLFTTIPKAHQKLITKPAHDYCTFLGKRLEDIHYTFH